MMHTISDFWKKFFDCGKVCFKKCHKRACCSPKIIEMWKFGTNIAHGVTMMPKPFVFKLHAALVHKSRQK